MGFNLIQILLIVVLFPAEPMVRAFDPCDDLIYQKHPPYIHPKKYGFNPEEHNLDMLLKAYFPGSFKDTKIKEITFEDYIKEIEKLEKNKDLMPKVAFQLNWPVFSSYMMLDPSNPAGLYSNSAKNIQRKIFYLLGEQNQFDTSLRETINQELWAHERREKKSLSYLSNIYDLILEFRTYFKGKINPAVDSPILIALLVLEEAPPSRGLLKIVQAQEKKLSAYPGLFQLLRAWILYKLGAFQELLDKTITPISLVSSDSVTNSILFLRALSLRALKKYDEALEILTDLLCTTEKDLNAHLQVEIMCLQVERAHTFDLFSSDLLFDEELLKDVAKFEISEEDLIKFLENNDLKATSRSILAHELMRRYLLTGRLKEMVTLYKKVDKQYLTRFMSLKPFVNKLVQSPKDNGALIRFAKELYHFYIFQEDTCINGYGVEGLIKGRCELCDILWNSVINDRCELCNYLNIKELFDKRIDSTRLVPPFVYFLRVTEHYENIDEKSEFEAESLHYLVKNCFRDGYRAKDCKWGINFNNDSPRWFRKLHTKYKGTIWAKKTPYYY